MPGATAKLTFTKYEFGLVAVIGYIQLDTPTTTQQDVLTVPQELRPTNSVCVSAYSGVASNFVKEQAFLYMSGKLELSAETTQAIYWLNFSYTV